VVGRQNADIADTLQLICHGKHLLAFCICGAHWRHRRIGLNCPCAVAVQPYVKLLCYYRHQYYYSSYYSCCCSLSYKNYSYVHIGSLQCCDAVARVNEKVKTCFANPRAFLLGDCITWTNLENGAD